MVDLLTDGELREIEARLAGTSPAKFWRATVDQARPYVTPADGAFLLHVRTDVDRLLFTVNEQRRLLDTQRTKGGARSAATNSKEKKK